MKKTILALLAAALLVIPAVAGDTWMTTIRTNFTGTTFTWWNDTDDMLAINAILFRHDAAVSNDVTFYRLDITGAAFEIETTGVTNSLQYIVVTPTGNGDIRVPDDAGLRIIQTATNQAFVVIDRRKVQ